MGISDTIFDKLCEVVKEVLECYYDDEETKHEIMEDEVFVNYVADTLKAVSSYDFMRYDRHKLDGVNWEDRAKDFLLEYI